jgi:type VI secretion system protein VasD
VNYPRQLGIGLLACIAFLSIGGCSMLGLGKEEKKKPPRSTINIIAGTNLNPDIHGKAAPVVARLYELSDRAEFDKADFFALYEKDTQLLAAAIVKRGEIELQPNQSQRIDRVLDEKTKFIAVIAAFRDIEKARWRYAFAVDPKKKLTYNITFDGVSANIQQAK